MELTPFIIGVHFERDNVQSCFGHKPGGETDLNLIYTYIRFVNNFFFFFCTIQDILYNVYIHIEMSTYLHEKKS